MTDTRRSTGDSGRDVESSQSSRSDQPSDPGDLVVVCGLPGAGKTTVAERISDRSDARILRTDVIRKELFSDPTYNEAETEAVYAELLERARDAVLDGRSVVLDATFAKRQFREDARELAERVANRFELVKVECDESVVRERIERRDGISDADFDVYLHFTELFDGIDSEHLVVDNSGSEATTFAQIDSAFE